MSEKLDAAFGADAVDYIRQLQAEIDRLRGEVESWKALVKQHEVQSNKDQVKLGRLQAELEKIKGDWHGAFGAPWPARPYALEEKS